MENLQTWLLEQAPVIVVMGVVIYGQWKIIKKKDEEIQRLNDEVKDYGARYMKWGEKFSEIFALIKDRL